MEVVVDDGSSLLNVTFFNQAWREKQLAVGTEVSLFGKLDVYRGKRQMTMPVVDVLGRAGVADDKTGVILPVYPQSGKAEVFTWQLRTLVGEALAKCRPRGFADPRRRGRSSTPTTSSHRGLAIRAIHRPESMGEMRAAEKRLKFDEFLRMQVGLVARKRALAAQESGIRHVVDGPDATLVAKLLDRLPFALTGDQRRGDRRDHARHGRRRADAPAAAGRRRLGQDRRRARGAADRGAGWVPGGVHGADRGARRAALPRIGAAARGVDRRRGRTRCSATGPVRVELLTNRTTAAERRRIAAGLARNEVDILVGTHALLYGDAEFTNLGLAVIDEQHRFGVEQRALLKGKATGEVVPDVLVMTATPIPRTAGDARLRRPRQVGAARDAARPHPDRHGGRRDRRRSTRCAMWQTLRDEVAAGHQAYVVCPLVDDKGTPGPSGPPRAGESKPRPRPRSSNGCRRRSCRACASGCCTGRCRRATRSR